MKNFFKAIWEWIKNIFLGIKLIDTKQLQEFVDELRDKSVLIVDALDLDKDGKISGREVIKAIKKYLDKDKKIK